MGIYVVKTWPGNSDGWDFFRVHQMREARTWTLVSLSNRLCRAQLASFRSSISDWERNFPTFTSNYLQNRKKCYDTVFRAFYRTGFPITIWITRDMKTGSSINLRSAFVGFESRNSLKMFLSTKSDGVRNFRLHLLSRDNQQPRMWPKGNKLGRL